MPIITLPKNLEDMNDGTSLIPAGTYEMTIDRVIIGVTKDSKKNTKLSVMWKNDGEEGGVIWDTVAVNVEFKVKQYTKLLGIDSGNTFDPDLLVGVKGIVEVISDSYTNPTTKETTPTAKIKRVSPAA